MNGGSISRMNEKANHNPAFQWTRKNCAPLKASLAPLGKEMSNDQVWNPKSAWRQFRLETETVKNYPSSYALYVGHTHRDILLEQLLDRKSVV